MNAPGETPIALDPAVIEELGLACGFAACGHAPLAPTARGWFLDAWLARGAHASMTWMAETAPIRKDPTTKWAWARTALVGAMPYGQPPQDRKHAPGLLRHVARYAWGRDYHDVVRDALIDWARALERARGAAFRHAALVDTSAVLDRELAERAGIGWIGKNTCLIGDGGDSWRFIGTLLVDFVVDGAPKPRLTERCGTCRACLDACPTAAFTGPYELDANRCISYLTIEHAGPIDDALKPSMQDWVFGCDVCQDVCPWNRRVQSAAPESLAADARLAACDVLELTGKAEGPFREQTRGTPLFRSKRARLVRNALIAAANLRLPGAAEAADALSDDPDEGIRDAARYALSRTED